MRRALGLCVALTAALVPGSAHAAATLALDRTPSAPKVVVTAAPGDTDGVSILRLEGDGAITVTDSAGLIIDELSGCLLSEDGLSALCPSPGPAARAVVRLGDGDDRATVAGIAAALFGGPGDDVLTGGAFADALAGGAGNDTLSGGEGDDRLSGDGEPLTAEGSTETPAVGTDRIDGGPGRDAVSYRGRIEPVAADLTRDMPAGQAGENDRLIGIEDVAGGEANDTLTGDAGGNRLEGGGGADTLTGASGDDELIGGPGLNTLVGGSGDDLLDASGAQLADGACGADIDEVAAPVAGVTVLGDDCERVLSRITPGAALLLDARPSAVSRKLLLVDAACPSAATRACSTTLIVRTEGAKAVTIATGSLRLSPGGAGQARLRLTASGRTLVKRGAPVRLRTVGQGFGWSAVWTPPRVPTAKECTKLRPAPVECDRRE